jgi:hypothetical protein
VDVKVLSNAAWFFEEFEKPTAEQLLLRAQARQPDSPQPGSWSSRLGWLYASVLVTEGDSPYGREVRTKLETSTDATLLVSASQRVLFLGSQSKSRTEFAALSRRYLERASQLDSPAGQRARERLRAMNPSRPMESSPELVEKSTGGLKLARLAAAAESEYLSAEYFDWRARQPEDNPERRSNPKSNPQQDKEQGTARFSRSKEYAQQALELASQMIGAPEYTEAIFRAHIASGLHALREGNRQTAVQHLLDASKVPPPAEPVAEPRSLLEYRLVDYLLKYGERETIVEYLERAAAGRTAEARESMLKAAAAIREGKMPEHYQRRLASGHL